jgi:hypothetical protein
VGIDDTKGRWLEAQMQKQAHEDAMLVHIRKITGMKSVAIIHEPPNARPAKAHPDKNRMHGGFLIRSYSSWHAFPFELDIGGCPGANLGEPAAELHDFAARKRTSKREPNDQTKNFETRLCPFYRAILASRPAKYGHFRIRGFSTSPR